LTAAFLALDPGPSVPRYGARRVTAFAFSFPALVCDASGGNMLRRSASPERAFAPTKDCFDDRPGSGNRRQQIL
jgi:hypothetical protein